MGFAAPRAPTDEARESTAKRALAASIKRLNPKSLEQVLPSSLLLHDCSPQLPHSITKEHALDSLLY